jgi:hypothetical protein
VVEGRVRGEVGCGGDLSLNRGLGGVIEGVIDSFVTQLFWLLGKPLESS